MMFAIVDLDILKEIDPQWEYRRRSNDGTRAIIHKEILDRLRPAEPMMLNLTYDDAGEVEEPPYPFPLVSGDEINAMDDFRQPDEDSGV